VVATYFTGMEAGRTGGQAHTELRKELGRFYDYGWAAKVKDRVCRQKNGLLHGLLDFYGCLRVPYGFLSFLRVSFWVLPLLS
jgi:hypothetical protein